LDDEQAQVLAAIELLPPDARAQLHALAARGPSRTQISPGAPLYAMNLVRVYKASLAFRNKRNQATFGAPGLVRQ